MNTPISIEEQQQALPHWLITLIGEYGHQRRNGRNEAEALHAYRQLLDGIRRFGTQPAPAGARPLFDRFGILLDDIGTLLSEQAEEERSRGNCSTAAGREAQAFALKEFIRILIQPPSSEDPDGKAFRQAAELGLTLRFYGGCAQSSIPGTPSAHEVVCGRDRAESMRLAIERAAKVIADGGEPQRLDQRPVSAYAGDSILLDYITMHRIAVIPEFQGPWDAHVYDDKDEVQRTYSGNDPRQAIRAAMAEGTA